MPGRGKLFGRAEGYECKLYSVYIPISFEEKSKLICLKRRMDLSEFVREAMFEHIKKYNNLIEKSKVVKPRNG